MSAPLLELGGQQNWLQVFDETRQVLINPTTQTYTPIAVFEIGFLFEAHTLAVRTRNPTAKAHWRLGGHLTQIIQAGSGGVASTLPSVIAERRRLQVNRCELVRFERLSSNYQLNFEPPFWFEQIQLTIWEYVGPESDTTEKLIELVREDIARIEARIG